MYKNRFRWFTQASSDLRTAWLNAGLSSGLVGALRRPDVWKDTALVVQVLEDITDMSTEWCRRLVADGFLDSVAEVILNFDQVEDGNPIRHRYIQCRLTRALLSVWRHCSTIPDIKWPMEKMLAVINSASSATELLLGRHATPIGPGARALPNVGLGKDALLDIRNRLKLFFDWANERLSNPAGISRDTAQPTRPQPFQRTEGEPSPASRFQLSRACSRESYVENSLL
ncbi:hypothetical protein M407DRAFT_18167 [Tulasnella calospora MUT 4182]|uniref:Uncharacterized protein n=1 Tax=Tulasnella calospora MUT 4182 TaxID=1051891 RepID=A0A0C3LGC5_9AGAM|nr:hypothetical protein M407DRAFT_18167 [Tulasnella calospora MUT 4182]